MKNDLYLDSEFDQNLNFIGESEKMPAPATVDKPRDNLVDPGKKRASASILVANENIHEVVSEINRIENYLETQKKSIARHQREIAWLEDRISELSENKEKLIRTQSELKAAQRQLMQENLVLEREAKEHNQGRERINELQKEISRLNSANLTLREQNVAACAKNESLASQLAQFEELHRVTTQQYEAHRAFMSTEYRKLTAAYRARSQRLSQVVAGVTQYQKRLQVYKDRLLQMQSHIQKQENGQDRNFADRDKKLAELKRELSAVREVDAERRKTIAFLIGENEKFKEAFRLLKTKSLDIQQHYKRSERQYRELIHDLNHLLGEILQLCDEEYQPVANAQAADGTKFPLAQVNALMGHLTNAVLQAKTNLHQVRNQLQNADQIARARAQDLTSLQEQYAKATSDLRQQRDENLALREHQRRKEQQGQVEVQNTKNLLSQEKQKVHELEATRARLMRLEKELRTEMDLKDKTIAELKRQYTGLKHDHETTLSENQIQQKKYQDLVARHDNLSDAYEQLQERRRLESDRHQTASLVTEKELRQLKENHQAQRTAWQEKEDSWRQELGQLAESLKTERAAWKTKEDSWEKGLRTLNENLNRERAAWKKKEETWNAERDELTELRVQLEKTKKDLTKAEASISQDDQISEKALRLQTRERHLNFYSSTVNEKRAQIRNLLAGFVDELKAATAMSPLKSYLTITEREISKVEIDLSRLPLVASERPRFEDILVQLVRQRDAIRTMIEQAEVDYQKKIRRLIELMQSDALAALPPLPPQLDL